LKTVIEGNGVYGDVDKIIPISEFYEVSVSVSLVSEGQITPPPTVMTGQVATERYDFLFGS
jgi:hypothetical protein